MFLIIYILGIIAFIALILYWLLTTVREDITLTDLVIILFLSLPSWISFFGGLAIFYGDNIIIFKSKRK